MSWLFSFLGALVGSLAAYAAAFVRRGTDLETSLQQLAVDLYRQVREGSMTVQGAAELLEASRPTVYWWTVGGARRVGRTTDAWLDALDDAHLLAGTLPEGLEPRYPVPADPHPALRVSGAMPAVVTAGQVHVARLRALRDRRTHRTTPDAITRIAAVRLPGDPDE